MFIKNIPNMLTILRITLIPVLVISFYSFEGRTARYIAAGIFLFASITDYFDGLLARLWKAQSNFGIILDPIADKMLVVSTLLMLIHNDMAPMLPTFAILCREIFISGLRKYLAELKISVPVSNLAKVKTTIQMLAILTLLLGEECTGIPYTSLIGRFALWIAALLTLITGYVYLKEAFKHLRKIYLKK